MIKYFSRFRDINYVLLLIILCIAAILRFWNYAEMPYMHDELSALGRAQFDSLSELIKGGVYTDTHPPGVQVFIYFWINLFGESEMVVKLPFIICGLLSIWFSYKIARFMFNPAVGLFTAAFMAVLQYMIMYSQLARPYASGMFLSVFLVWCWLNYFFNTGNGKLKWIAGFIIAGSLCAYNHHFSLLFAAFVGLTGLFFINRKNAITYFLSGVVIFLLYIPNLKIFFYQLGIGGLGNADGWLGKPRADWFFTYLGYIFHFSYYMYGLVIIMIIAAFLLFKQDEGRQRTFRIICFCWFFAMFATAYLYSVFVNPVIQYSVLAFSFPFFLMFIFSYFPDVKGTYKIILTLAIIITGVFTLANERKHFLVFYKQPYQEYAKNTFRLISENGNNPGKFTIELPVSKYQLKHYFRKYKSSFPSIYYDCFEGKPDPKGFRNFVDTLKTEYFVFGNPPLEYIQIIKEKYPFLICKDYGFSYTYYCFARSKPANESREKVFFQMKGWFKKELLKQRNDTVRVFKTDITGLAYALDSTEEYSKTIYLQLKDLVFNRHSIINISACITAPDSAANPLIVFDMTENKKPVQWMAADFIKYNNKAGKANYMYLSMLLSDITLADYPEAVVGIYFWNHKKNNFLIHDFNIEVKECNPYIYGLYEAL